MAAGARMSVFGPFRLFPERRLLTRDGVPVPLGGRALDIFMHLAAHAGKIVSKAELMAAVWPGRAVEENNLTVHISTLRRLLGEGGEGRSLIQTVPGRGYMLLAGAVGNPPAGGTPTAGSMTVMPLSFARPASSFVGRVQERAGLIAQLSEYPLVTVTAIGGIGKTRLAQQVAQELAPGYPDGVHVAELASVDDPALAAEQVAALFPLGSADRPAIERLVGFLRTRRLLLVLDNCEHLMAPVAELAAAILARCPGVSILATSREALGVAGECVFRLRPLPVPTRLDGLSADEAIRYDAIHLFVERAAAAVPDFVFDDEAVPAIAAICAQLDGIALAIEMAVPRLRVLSLAQVAERLRDSLNVLAIPDRTTAPRHRTLRAMLDWSYTLLPVGEQTLLRRLSVFAGAVDFAAVQAVAGDDDAAETAVLDDLTGLIDKSLVVVDRSPGAMRYRLLETVRHYARERAAESGETALRRRHAVHYAAVFEAAAASWPVLPTEAWAPAVIANADELRTALAWCFSPAGDTLLGLRLVGASTPLWWELPNLPLREGRGWFERALKHLAPDTPPLVAARVWLGHSWRDVRLGDTENFPSAERAVALFRRTDDLTGLGAALWRAGSAVLTRETTAAARAYLVEAEAALRRVPPGKWLTLCLVKLGDLAMRSDEDAAALAAYEEAMALARRTRHWYGLMNGGSNMAEMLFHLGRRDEALAQLRGLRDELPIALRAPLTATLAAHLVIAGEVDEAADAIAEVVDIAPAIGFGAALAWAIETLALLRARDGDTESAARLAGYAGLVLPSPATRAGARRAVYQALDEVLARLPNQASLKAAGACWDEVQATSIAWIALAKTTGV
jgi:predicted ATPase